VAGGWRKRHNEEFHNLYASPNIRVIKAKSMGWVGQTEIGIDGANGFGWLRMSLMASFCKHGNEPSGSKKKAGYSLTS
jgi:hypothetical protein